MITADPLHRDDLARRDALRSLLYGIITRGRFRAINGRQPDAGAADRTSIRLGMKTTARRIVVFTLALRTHSERPHRRIRAIVGQRLDDRVARSTLRAIDERITIAAISRIPQLGPASFT